MRNKKKQEEKEALEGKGKKEDRRADLPGGVTFVDRQREAAVSSDADIKKELRVSNQKSRSKPTRQVSIRSRQTGVYQTKAESFLIFSEVSNFPTTKSIVISTKILSPLKRTFLNPQVSGNSLSSKIN